MNFLWIALMLIGGISAAEGQIHIVPRTERLLVFGDQKQHVPLAMTNVGAAKSANIEFRVFQVAGTVAAPIGDRKAWKVIEIGAGQTVLENLFVDLPPVKAPSGFVIRLYEGSRDAGSLRLDAFPTNLLSDLAKSHEIMIFDDANLLRGLEGIRVKNLSDPILAEKPVLLISSRPIDPGTLSDLSSKLDAIVHIATVHPGDVEHLSIEGFEKNKAFIVSADSRLVGNLPSSPEAQLNLIRAVKFALRRGGIARIQE